MTTNPDSTLPPGESISADVRATYPDHAAEIRAICATPAERRFEASLEAAYLEADHGEAL